MMKVIVFFIYLFILANFAEKKVARLLYTSAANNALLKNILTYKIAKCSCATMRNNSKQK
jgi:hypothetical protein